MGWRKPPLGTGTAPGGAGASSPSVEEFAPFTPFLTYSVHVHSYILTFLAKLIVFY